MATDSQRTPRVQENNQQFIHKFSLTLVALLTGGAAIFTGCMYGFERAGVLGASVGAASAVGCLLAPGLFVEAIRAREVARAVAAGVMLVICGALAISGALGAAAVTRDVAQRSETKLADDRARTKAEHEAARSAIARLPQARPAAVVDAELAPILKDARLAGCEGWLANAALRNTCIREVEPRRKELAIAHSRERREAELRRTADRLSSMPTGRPASADAEALSRLAGRLGWPIAPDMITDGLLVLLVLATELVGGLALLLARSAQRRPDAGQRPIALETDTPAASPSKTVAPGRRQPTDRRAARQEVEAAVRRHLQSSGGHYKGSVRALSAAIQRPRSTVHDVLAALATSGAAVVAADAAGTSVRLV